MRETLTKAYEWQLTESWADNVVTLASRSIALSLYRRRYEEVSSGRSHSIRVGTLLAKCVRNAGSMVTRCGANEVARFATVVMHRIA